MMLYLALIVESIDAVNTGTLVVSTQQKKVLRIFDLARNVRKR